MITTVFTQNRAVYGTHRLKKVLEKQGHHARRRRIGCIMQEAQLQCKTKRRFRATNHSKHQLPIAPNQLARQLNVNQPDQEPMSVTSLMLRTIYLSTKNTKGTKSFG